LQGVVSHPVVLVSWNEAMAYCRWLTEKLREWTETPEPLASLLRGQTPDGRKWCVTLAGEAEWEKAARGRDGRIYPWGETADPECANFDDTGIGRTSAVGCFPRGASPYGVEELSGNVWEWTRSLWGKDWREADFGYPYNSLDGRENTRAPGDWARVVRGGAFGDPAWDARSAVRYGFFPVRRYNGVGFRLVVSDSSLNSDPLGSGL
jgi:formylglycine-generating enzyme required for sulfatase activity